MTEVEKLVKQVEKLGKEDKNQVVINLLDDKTLEKYNNSDLFIERARAYLKKGEYDKSLIDCVRSINIGENAKNLFVRGVINFYKENYDKAEEDYKKVIELDPKSANTYLNYGNVWYRREDYNKAIEYYKKAIELKPNFEMAYYVMGNAWQFLGKYDEAIKSYDKAIQLKADYAEAYNNRGLSLFMKNDYANAIKNFEKAIVIKPDYADAITNLGHMFYNVKAFENARELYKKAIDLIPNFVKPWFGLGNVYYHLGKYNEAIEAYNKVLELQPDHQRAKFWRDKVNSLLGVKIQIDNDNSDKPFYLLYKTVDKLPEQDRNQILQKSIFIMDSFITKIRGYATINIDEYVSHYTKLYVADALINTENARFNYYNAVYMNDPEEGKTLLKCFDKHITNSFESGQEKEENNIYIGSFLPTSKYEDELVMWRTYGKDENNCEASGCNIIVDTTFFDKENIFINPELNKNPIDKNKPYISQTLYKVFYYDKRNKKFIGENKNELTQDIKDLKKELRELINLKGPYNRTPEKNNAIDKIVYYILSEIRYLFKSSDYSFENELRVIQFLVPENENVKIDYKAAGGLPKKLYIESSKHIQPYLRKIILGPKVPHPNQWLYLEAIMKKREFNMDLKVSECNYQ